MLIQRLLVLKILNFLMLYGGGGYMLARNLTLSGVPTKPDEGEEFLEGYDSVLYPGVKQYRLSLCRVRPVR